MAGREVADKLVAMREQFTSAVETIRSIKSSGSGVVFTFRAGLNLDVQWCINEIVMLARAAKLKVKKRDIHFSAKPYSLYLALS